MSDQIEVKPNMKARITHMEEEAVCTVEIDAWAKLMTLSVSSSSKPPEPWYIVFFKLRSMPIYL